MRNLLLLLGLCVSLLACAPQVSPFDGAVIGGQWGGVSMNLLFDADGARVDFGCALGVILEPIVLRGGRFEARGLYALREGTPSPQTLVGRRVHYRGRFQEGLLIATVTPRYSVGTIGTFVLRPGVEPTLTSCL